MANHDCINGFKSPTPELTEALEKSEDSTADFLSLQHLNSQKFIHWNNYRHFCEKAQTEKLYIEALEKEESKIIHSALQKLRAKNHAIETARKEARASRIINCHTYNEVNQ